MKLVDGESLAQLISDCEHPAGRLALLAHVLAAADAVAYAHAQGIIHRDLKPANILVGEHGETLVIDWGLARDLTGGLAEPAMSTSGGAATSVATLTDVGAIVGTLRYMPPEQARGEAVDPRSDVFALGAVLFHVIAGRPPHEGLTRASVLARLSDGDIEDLRPLADGVPPALVAIARKAMAPDPADRYLSAEEFAEDLRRFLAGRLVDAHRYQAGELLRAWMRRHRAVLVVGAVALLALLAASLVFVRDLGTERDVATTARRQAELAQAEALRRADAAVLAQARGALAEDLVAALTLLRQVDLSHEERRRSAHLTALAAQARGAPDRVLRGHLRNIETFAALSDGGLVSIDAGGEVRRWDPRTGAGEVIVDLDAPRGLVIAAAEAPVWVALVGHRGHVVRADGAPETIDLGELDVSAYRTHRWELSRHGETLAALLTGTVASQRRAVAYTWDLLARPALPRALPFEYLRSAALSPDGAIIATSDRERRTWLIAGEASTSTPALQRPQMFSASGHYLLGRSVAGPPAEIVLSMVDASLRAIEGRIAAITPDDHAFVVARDPTGGIAPDLPKRLSLRSLATGETRWTADLEITRAVISAIWGDRGGFAVSPVGDRFALQLGAQWQIWSMTTGTRERTLDTGAHRRGTFLADGSFVVAHYGDLWLWSPPPPARPDHHAYALAADGSFAVVADPAGQYPRLLRLADGSESRIACIGRRDSRALAKIDARLAVDARGRVLFIDEAGAVCLDDGEARSIATPTRATAAALADRDDALAIGTADGTILAWPAPTTQPRRWQLDAQIRRLWLLGEDLAIIAQTGLGTVVALDAEDDAPVVLGGSMPDRDPDGVRVVIHPQRRAAAVLLGDEDAVVFHAVDSPAIRRPIAFSSEPAAAYSPSGRRFAVGLAGRLLLVLASPDEAGRELALPEEARGLGFLSEDELVVVGDSGGLIRVDLVVGEALVIAPQSISTVGPTRVIAAGDQIAISAYSGLTVQPLNPVPGDSSELAAWLARRIR